MTQVKNIKLATAKNLPNNGVIHYENSQSITKESLLADLGETGIILLKGVYPGSTDGLKKTGRLLGTIDVGVEEALLGPTIMHLRYAPESAREDHAPTYYTSNFFPLHTDVSYVPNPPRFMLLHCVHPDPEGGGINLLADCNKALALLHDSDHETISTRLFNFLYPPNCREGQSQAYAIFENSLWRYKYSSMRFPEGAAQAVERFNQLLTDISIPVSLNRGDLLIVDNHRIAHGRTAFKHVDPSLPGRHIMRLYATTGDQA